MVANLLEYQGDLLTADVDVIAHQCNCVSIGVAGLAAMIFKQYPEANDNLTNPNRDRYGTYILHFVQDVPFRAILNLFTQLYPGTPADIGQDTQGDRLAKFALALQTFLEDYDGIFESIAFPYMFGSGLAGGHWPAYRNSIAEFARMYRNIEFHIIEKK